MLQIQHVKKEELRDLHKLIAVKALGLLTNADIRERVEKRRAEDGPLTPRRQKFVENYVANGGNGKKAAEVAGFAKGHAAEVEASRLLRNAEVRARIQARVAEAGG